MPRSARGLIAETFRLYRAHPLLFLTLAAAVLAPYDLVVLAVTGGGPMTGGNTGAGTALLLAGLDLFVVGALISSLHVHALALVRDGAEPRLLSVAQRGLRVLPVVVAATIVAGLGTLVGLFFFLVPGIVIFLRLSVVAQVAAIEHEGWIPALQRSWKLTEFRFRHLLAFFALVFLITVVVFFVLASTFSGQTTTLVSFVGGLVFQTLVSSFAALAMALLYSDLLLRRELLAVEAPVRVAGLVPGTPVPEDTGPSGPSTVAADAQQASWDPRVYSDPERPTGWYVVPARPHRMRYWMAGEEPTWHPQSARTPKRLREDWEREVGLRGPAR